LEVQIQKFETHYRLPRWAWSEQRRLEEVRAMVLERAFAIALESNRVSEEAELCFRNLFVPVRVNLRGSDESIVVDWSTALAVEITRSLRNGPTANAVIYYSRRQALLDLAVNVARGDLSRAWAWHQLGLWRSSGAVSERQAVVEFVHALHEEAGMVVPTLRALAQAGLLHRVADRITEEQWEELASAALFEAGSTYLLTEAGGAPSSMAFRDAGRVLKHSSLLRAIVSSSWLKGAGVITRRAVAALVVLEVEPARLSAETAPALIDIIAETILSAPNKKIDDWTKLNTAGDADSAKTSAMDLSTSGASQPTKTVDDEPAVFANAKATASVDDLTEFGVANSTAVNDMDATTPNEADQQSSGISDPSALDHSGWTSPGDAGTAKRDGREKFVAPLVSSAGQVEAETGALDLRRRAFTRFGGLLFLVAALDDLGLPEEIIAQPVFSARPFLWVLHQLALALAPMDQNDPAALAFVGLPPGAKPPSEGEAALSEIEASALNTIVAQVVERLRELLACDDEADVLLETLCHRTAEIVADPGWIEVRLSLDDVATDIRRAGLDLNPGYVPWLGVAVVFVYE
jgi:hypothetical protein